MKKVAVVLVVAVVAAYGFAGASVASNAVRQQSSRLAAIDKIVDEAGK